MQGFELSCRIMASIVPKVAALYRDHHGKFLDILIRCQVLNFRGASRAVRRESVMLKEDNVSL